MTKQNGFQKPQKLSGEGLCVTTDERKAGVLHLQVGARSSDKGAPRRHTRHMPPRKMMKSRHTQTCSRGRGTVRSRRLKLIGQMDLPAVAAGIQDSGAGRRIPGEPHRAVPRLPLPLPPAGSGASPRRARARRVQPARGSLCLQPRNQKLKTGAGSPLHILQARK